MGCTVTQESFDSLTSMWNEPDNGLSWSSVFILPVWMQTWWQVFGDEAELYLRAVRRGGKVIGIAPLKVKDGVASFVGNSDVCDYLDFIVVPGEEAAFYNTLLDDLSGNGIKRLELESLRPDSAALTSLAETAVNRNCEVTIKREGVSLDMGLPATWEEYLQDLNSKQRHEIRRKLRRLQEEGQIDYRTLEKTADIQGAMGTFLKMFAESREDKAEFLTEQMESFFRLLTEKLSDAGLLKLGILELDSVPAAMVMCFDYNDGIYLYNSGYDPQYTSLSAGLLSKALCIKESIAAKKKRFDFLRGDEVYKYRLGGKEIPIYNCRIEIK
jgi:CelD/BcsL family acetyltransferase involved in cellulose biosynthesis